MTIACGLRSISTRDIETMDATCRRGRNGCRRASPPTVPFRATAGANLRKPVNEVLSNIIPSVIGVTVRYGEDWRILGRQSSRDCSVNVIGFCNGSQRKGILCSGSRLHNYENTNQLRAISSLPDLTSLTAYWEVDSVAHDIGPQL